MRSDRATASEQKLIKRPLHGVALLCCTALAASATLAGGPGPARSPAVVLRAIESGTSADSFTLLCEGSFQHRVTQTADHLTLIVELPDATNAVPPESLPAPRGLVNAVAVGGGDGEPVRIVFSLNRPCLFDVRVKGGGLELRFREEPEATGAGSREAQDGQPVPGGQSRAADGSSAAVGSPAADDASHAHLDAVPPSVGGGAPPPPPGFESSGVDFVAPERPLGAEDLLDISVFEIPDLNRKVRVSERGSISLPLLGEVKVEGLTPRELEMKLREALGEKYVKDPQISVFVEEHGSKKVSVLGAVGKPGVYEMLGQRNLLQVLSQAGGLTPGVAAELYVIRSRPGGSSDRIAINVNDLLSNRDPSLNVLMEPGDIVSVPLDQPIYIYVDGAVKTPGRIDQLASRPITLLQAIAKAGGATERANLRAIQILRQSKDGTQTTVEINLKRIRQGKEPDPLLGDGDVVVVPETFF